MADPDPWYPHEREYYVPAAEAAEYPVRQGDVFGPHEGTGVGWLGCMVVHPSCEIQTGKAPLVQVARIHAVSELPKPFQQTSVTFGFTERDGVVSVAFANTFWLPPATEEGPLSEPLFVDFRDVACVEREVVGESRRVRPMSHEARLYLIRRKIYFRYRWNLSLDDIRRTEAQRISGDAAFRGPLPEWVTGG